MRPIYDDGMIRLYRGDCRYVTAWQSDTHVLVTDPPYGISYKSRQGKHRSIAGDESTALRDTVLGMWGDRPALVFGSWRSPRPDGVRVRIVWWKRGNGPGMGDLSMPWGTSDEEIYVLGRGFRGRRRPNVIVTDTSQSALTRKIGHPTPKPMPVMTELVECCPTDWVIADPFAGSGSTLVAAKMLGRRAIGVELEDRYCDIIIRRLTGQLPVGSWPPPAP